MNIIQKISIAQNEIEKYIGDLSVELGLDEESIIFALELTTARIRAMASMRDAYKEYDTEKQKAEEQNEFAKKMQNEIENSLKEETK